MDAPTKKRQRLYIPVESRKVCGDIEDQIAACTTMMRSATGQTKIQVVKDAHGCARIKLLRKRS